MKLPFHPAASSPALSPETARQMLSNVFVACDREPNTVPLDTLLSYSNYRKERYSLQRAVIILVLILFMLLPLMFFPAGVRITLSNPDGEANPVYAVSVSGQIPIRQIQATMDGRTVPIYEVSAREYMLQPNANGEMLVCVTLLNRQRTEAAQQVDAVDADAPVLVSTEPLSHAVRLHVEDVVSGVDFGKITLTGSDGSAVAPIASNAASGWIDVPYPDPALTVRIPDLRGNALQIELRPEG